MPSVTQPSLFAPEPGTAPVKPAGRLATRMRILITVKAAPNPSQTYGETVCVAGLRLDPDQAGWIRLYPVNFRELDGDSKFKKYDVVSLTARPNPGDPRAESWRPEIDTLTVETKLPSWPRRQAWVSEHVDGTMCGLIEAVSANPAAKSLAAIRPKQVTALDIKPHGGWSPDEQRRIDRYVSQLPLPGMSRGPKTALEAPRFKGWYRYLCQAPGCRGHNQGIYDWEWVAFQRHFPQLPDQEAIAEIRNQFLLKICAQDKDLVFFVGNQQKHPRGFMVLGMFYPPLSPRR